MRNASGHSYAGYVAMAGGAMGLLLAPVMVIIKYMTGWAVIPEPPSLGVAQEALGGLLRFVLMFPSAVVASITLLPTTPSGALWLFSLMMITCGYCLAMGKNDRLIAASVCR